MNINRILRTVLMVTLSMALAIGMWGVMPAGIAEAAGIDFPLLEENFNYGTTVGNLTAVTLNWTVHSGTGTPPQYVTSNLSMAGYGSSGFGGAVTIDNANAPDVNRAFSTSTISDILYYAALVNISTATTTGDYFLHMKDNGTYFRGRLFAKDESGVLRFGIAASGTAVYSTDSFSYNTTYLVVVKYDPSTDDASLYVLTSYSATEPASPTAFSDGTFTTGNAQLAIALRQSTNIPDATIDGIRVAKDWNTVVGQDTVTLSSLTAGNTYYFGDTLVAMALTSGDPGTVSVTKHSVPPGGDPASTGEMPLQWNITATGSGFALDLMLCYNDEELGGLTEANLLAYRWEGTSWGTGMGTVDTVNNCVTVTGITGFSKWALGTSQPTAVTFSGLSAASPFAALAVGLLAAAGLVVLRKRK